MGPLPAAPEVIHPVPPQTSKRGGCQSTASSCSLLPRSRRRAGSRGCPGRSDSFLKLNFVFKTADKAAKGTKHQSNLKRRSTFRALVLSTSKFSFWPVGHSRPPASASKFRNRNSANGHSMPLRAPPHQLKRKTLTTYAMRVSPPLPGQRPGSAFQRRPHKQSITGS